MSRVGSHVKYRRADDMIRTLKFWGGEIWQLSQDFHTVDTTQNSIFEKLVTLSGGLNSIES